LLSPKKKPTVGKENEKITGKNGTR